MKTNREIVSDRAALWTSYTPNGETERARALLFCVNMGTGIKDYGIPKLQLIRHVRVRHSQNMPDYITLNVNIGVAKYSNCFK